MKYNIENIKSFVRFIELNSPVETTNKYLRETFFNNNKQVSASVFKILKESGILMTNNSWGKGKGQKWYYLNNDVDIELLFIKEPVVKEPVVKEPVVKEPVAEIITTEFGHFIIEKPTHYNIFKSCLKLTESTFGSIWQDAVIQECCINGLTKEQAEYLWSRYENYVNNNA